MALLAPILFVAPVLSACSSPFDRCRSVDEAVVDTLSEAVAEVPRELAGWTALETFDDQGCDSGDAFRPTVETLYAARPESDPSNQQFINAVEKELSSTDLRRMACGRSTWFVRSQDDGWLVVMAWPWAPGEVFVSAYYFNRDPADHCQ